jgi:hypothetical protein
VRPILTYATETWTITKKMKEDWVSSKGKSFAEYMVQHAREGSGRRDTTDNQKSCTMTQIQLT